MLLGTDIASVLTTLTALDVQAIGLNCSTGPEDMRDAIRFLGEHSPLPVHCIPNAGLPLQGPNGETIFPEEPEPLAAALQEYVERYGVSIVGGCCGTKPEHIEAIAERVKGREPGARPEASLPPQVSSMMGATLVAQEPRPNDRGRARELAGLPPRQADAARRRLRRAAPDRREPGGGGRARARRVRGPDRAPGRGRADAPAREAHLAAGGRADPGRLHRAERAQGRARADPRPRDRQLDQPRGRAATSSTRSCR